MSLYVHQGVSYGNLIETLQQLAFRRYTLKVERGEVYLLARVDQAVGLEIKILDQACFVWKNDCLSYVTQGKNGTFTEVFYKGNAATEQADALFSKVIRAACVGKYKSRRITMHVRRDSSVDEKGLVEID